VEWGGQWGELGRERELLRLRLRLLVLLVGGVWGGDVEDVVAILLLLLRLGVRRTLRCIWGVS
jgi:hypothetical protein